MCLLRGYFLAWAQVSDTLECIFVILELYLSEKVFITTFSSSANLFGDGQRQNGRTDRQMDGRTDIL